MPHVFKEHEKRPDQPIKKFGACEITRCNTKRRASICGYLGLNFPDDKFCTKLQLVMLAAHPIHLRAFLIIEQAIDAVSKDHTTSVKNTTTSGKRISSTDFLDWVERLRRIDKLQEGIAGGFASDQDEADFKDMTCASTTEASLRFGTDSECLFPALLFHWSQSLDELPLFYSGDAKTNETVQIYQEFDTYIQAKSNIQLPNRFRDTTKTPSWPYGLEREKLKAHGETSVEIFNRLWQLFWFMKSHVFSTSDNPQIIKPSTHETVYKLDDSASGAPLWWSSNVDDTDDAIAEYEQARIEQAGEFGDTPSSIPIPALPCSLVVMNREDEDEVDDWKEHFQKKKMDITSFAADGTLVSNPCLYTDPAEWRNTVREELCASSFHLAISRIALIAHSENGDRLGLVALYDTRNRVRPSHHDIIEFFRLAGAARVEVAILFASVSKRVNDMEQLAFHHHQLAISDGKVVSKAEVAASSTKKAVLSSQPGKGDDTNRQALPSAAAAQPDKGNDTNRQALPSAAAAQPDKGNDTDRQGLPSAAPPQPDEGNDTNRQALPSAAPPQPYESNDINRQALPSAAPPQPDEGNDTDRQALASAVPPQPDEGDDTNRQAMASAASSQSQTSGLRIHEPPTIVLGHKEMQGTSNDKRAREEKLVECNEWPIQLRKELANKKLSRTEMEHLLDTSITSESLLGCPDWSDMHAIRVAQEQQHNAPSETQRAERVVSPEITRKTNARLVALALKASESIQKKKDKKLGKTKSSTYPSLYRFTTPAEAFATDRQKRTEDVFFQEEYDGHDTRTAEGLLSWIRKAIDTIVPDAATTTTAQGDMDDDEVESFERFLQQQKDLAIGPELSIDIDPDVVMPPTVITKAPDDREIESTLSGITGREGPGVDLCLELFDMVKSKPHRGDLWNYKSTGELGQLIATDLLATQVTGITHALIRTFGTFPLSEKQRADKDKRYENIVKKLNYDGPKVGGGFIEDVPGLGKTFLVLAFFSWFAAHGDHTDEHGYREHRPTLLVVPDGHVFNQWVDAINNKFPTINLIVTDQAYAIGNRPPLAAGEPERKYTTVGAKAITGEVKWPNKLDYIFDKTNARASSVLMIASYTSWRRRVVERVDLTTDEVEGREDPPDWWVRKKGTLNWESLEMRTLAEDRWRGKFKMTLLDEGHLTRNHTSQTHWSIRHLNASFNWIISATPIVNSAEDLANLTRMVWPAAEKSLRADPCWDEVEARYNSALDTGTPTKFWDWLSHPDTRIGGIAMGPTSIWRLLYMQPTMLSTLLQTRDIQLIGRYCRDFNALTSLRRSPNSRLPGFAAGIDGKLDLAKIMVPHKTETLVLKHKTSDKSRPEHDAWHRRATQDYENICHEWAIKGGAKKSKDGSQRPPPAVSNPLSKMAIVTASTRLARLAYIIGERCHKGNTRVETIKKWRDSSLNVDMVLDLTSNNRTFTIMDQHRRPSRIDRLKMLIEGSPKLAETFAQIRDHVLPQLEQPSRFRKLLITEEFPLIAWYWELVLNELHIPTQVIHSDLSKVERSRVIQDFTTPAKVGNMSHLAICILMYTINANGVNLDADCNRAIVNTAAANASLELQGCCRIIRVSQNKEVTIVRLCVQNSHDEWRDAVQANKALFDAATKAYSDDALQVCCALLNTHGVEEETEIMESKLGKRCMELVQSMQAGTLNGKDPLSEIIRHMADRTNLQKRPSQATKPAQSETRTGEVHAITTSNETGDSNLVEASPEVPSRQVQVSKARMPSQSRRKNNEEDEEEDEKDEEEDDNEKEDDDIHNDPDFIPTEEDIDPEEFAFLDDPLINDLLNGSDPNSSIKYLADDTKIPEFHNTTTMTVWWREFWAEWMADTDKEHFGQDIIYTLYICMLNPHKKTDWTPSELRMDSLALERALRMLNRRRFGIKNPSLRITPYINYESLKGEDGAELINPYLKQERSEKERKTINSNFGVRMHKVPSKNHAIPDLAATYMEGPEAELESQMETEWLGLASTMAQEDMCTQVMEDEGFNDLWPQDEQMDGAIDDTMAIEDGGVQDGAMTETGIIL